MNYDEQLDRAIESTPEIQDSVGRFSLPDPDIRQEGNAAVYENFQETLDSLGREQRHVMRYLQTELGTSASIDERGRLRLTGEFDSDRIREALESYADGYVLCSECGLPDTNLVVENGVTLLQCEACGARSATGS